MVGMSKKFLDVAADVSVFPFTFYEIHAPGCVVTCLPLFVLEINDLRYYSLFILLSMKFRLNLGHVRFLAELNTAGEPFHWSFANIESLNQYSINYNVYSGYTCSYST